jgi:hypothetical protein
LLAKDDCVRVPVTRPVYKIRVVLATCTHSSRSAVDDCLHRVMGHRRKYEAHATLDPNGLPKIGLPAGCFACTCASSIGTACFVRSIRAIQQGVIVWVPWQRMHALSIARLMRTPKIQPERSARIEPVFFVALPTQTTPQPLAFAYLKEAVVKIRLRKR